jgi:hypothetical protein
VVPSHHSAILLCCSKQEARTLHEQAHHERRTVSAYVLNIIMKAVHWDERFSFRLTDVAQLYAIRSRGPRTKVLLRCSQQEASRIHKAAKKGATSVSAFIMTQLRTAWQVKLRGKAENQPQRQLRSGDQINANLPGRIVAATIRSAVAQDYDGRLEIEFGNNEVARIWPWQVLGARTVKYLPPEKILLSRNGPGILLRPLIARMKRTAVLQRLC